MTLKERIKKLKKPELAQPFGLLSSDEQELLINAKAAGKCLGWTAGKKWGTVEKHWLLLNNYTYILKPGYEMNRRDTMRQELNQPNPGGPMMGGEWTHCEHCDNRIHKDTEVCQCSQCGKQLCLKCVYIPQTVIECFCTHIVTDYTTLENKYYPTECVELWYDKKLTEANQKVFDLEELAKNLQRDIAEKNV